ncbi:helix-turn-helix domain-containing protein [Achromobacter sp. ESBL13]|uniref:helix-turn-helix domain-containing protein n=1 Tax=Achromobacter sp. ESBL13 TaxID=3077328 RepID=UPI002FCBABC6
MRQVLDCGVLLAPGHEAAMRDWVARHQSGLPRVRLHLVPMDATPAATRTSAAQPTAGYIAAPPADGAPDVQVLARMAVALRRYDSCVLPVAPWSVAWARTALSMAGADLTTPLLLLMDDMKAPAIEDLLGLGATDFMAQPACLESMRVRLGRLCRPVAGRLSPWQQQRVSQVQESAANYLAPGDGAGLPPHAPRPRVAPDVLEQGLASLRDPRRLPAHEAFRLAKSRVVAGFERDYIHHALSRHGGNVAQAARASAKHRRAFWALMRKHGIDAAPFRRAAQLRGLRP